MSVSAREQRLKSEARVVMWVRIFMIAVAVAVGVVEILVGLNVWKAPVGVVYGGRIALVVGTATEGIWGLARKTRWDKYIELKTKLDKILTAAVVSVAKETGIEVDALGVSVWAVEKHKGDDDTLVRQGSLRLSGYPPPSSTTWTRGKGVIGMCWDEDRVVYASFVEAQAKYPADKSISKAQWAKEKSQWGFTQSEYPRQIRKYSQILAVPFGDGEEFRGCLSLDIATEREVGVTIDTTEVREILGQNGISVYSLLVTRGTL